MYDIILFFRDAVNDLALHFFAKMKIMVVKDIERDEIEFVCKVGTSNAFRNLAFDIIS